MTLSTDLLIIDPTDPEKVFQFVLGMVARDFPGEPTWRHTRKGEVQGKWTADSSCFMTTLGQGLPALTTVTYADDGPLVACDPEWYEDDPEWVPPPCQLHCVRVNWDTAYSYCQGGEGCGDLHARYIATVGHWLDEQGLTWWWQNEFTGEYHKGAEGLGSLGDGGAEASAWFSNVALPAIQGGLV